MRRRTFVAAQQRTQAKTQGFRLGVIDADGGGRRCQWTLAPGGGQHGDAGGRERPCNGQWHCRDISPTNTFANTVAGVTLGRGRDHCGRGYHDCWRQQRADQNTDISWAAITPSMNCSAIRQIRWHWQAGLFQGISTAIGLQNARSAIAVCVNGFFPVLRLADVGKMQQLGGNLAVDSAKLAKALENLMKSRIIRSTERQAHPGDCSQRSGR